MIIQKRSLGWLPRPSMWSAQQSARSKVRASNERFLGNQTSFLNGVSAAQSNLLTGTGQLVTNIAVARIISKKA